VLGALGCNGNDLVKQPPSAESVEKSKPALLDETAARQALIELLESEDAPHFDTRSQQLAALKKGKNLVIMTKESQGLSGGNWNCDLVRKKFTFITQIGGCLYECDGLFEHVDGHWHAKSQGGSWGHLGPKGPP
jgi:hypothetical protein